MTPEQFRALAAVQCDCPLCMESRADGLRAAATNAERLAEATDLLGRISIEFTRARPFMDEDAESGIVASIRAWLARTAGEG